MHPSRKPYRFLSRSFPGRLPMLSASLMVSLALTGCAGGDDAATSGTPKSTALSGFVFDQIPGEIPHILASEPPEHESADALAETPSITDTLTNGPLMLAQTEPAHVMVDQFGNILSQVADYLVADASAETTQNTAPAAGSSGQHVVKHPRPTPYLPDDADLPSWVRTGNYGRPNRNPDEARNAIPVGEPQENVTSPQPAQKPAAEKPSDSGSRTQPASRNRLVTATNLQLDSPEFARLYGPGVFTQNALANTVIGNYRNQTSIVSNRFRATVNGTLDRVRLYWQSGLGYAGGTGGVIRISLYPDDGSAQHLPDLKATPMSSGTYVPGLRPGDNPKSMFPEIRMDKKSQPMVAGRIYHLVMENTDPAAHENFISSNNSITPLKNGRPARWLNTLDWSTLIGKRPRGSTRALTWTNLTEVGSGGNSFSPILQMILTNGQSQGVSDMEGGTVDNKLIYTATVQKPIRERFPPRSDKRVSGLSFATAASVAGRLQWRILDGSNVLASGYINEGRPNYNPIQSNANYRVGNFKWYDIELPAGKDVVMKAGRSYDLEFQPEGASQWKFGDHRNGSSYGFSWPAAFTESQAQLMLGGRWIGSNHWNHAQSGQGANWPVVLHLAP